MNFLTTDQATTLLDRWGQSAQPFFFFVDYAGEQWYAVPLDAVDSRIKYSLPGRRNYTPEATRPAHYPPYRVIPPHIEDYGRAFEEVQQAIRRGETTFINLTWRVPFESAFDQVARFHLGKEKYMLMVEGMFSVFSPEPFVEIVGSRVATFPMKGTISAEIPNAAEQLLSNEKEAKEHAQSVALMRTDLSGVAVDIDVPRYRYCEVIADGKVIQTSSEVAGTVRRDLLGRYGSIIRALLPGGSIAGAPKAASLEVIRRAEAFDRGFYTGIFGVFDGHQLNTSVMIRFIQYTDGGQKYFFGGGGITADSVLEAEYQELLLKAHATILY